MPAALPPPAAKFFKQRLSRQAQAFGFDLCQIASPDALRPQASRLHQWLSQGYGGDMDWMAQTAQRRADPRVLWADVRSIVVLGVNYGPDCDPRAGLAQKSQGLISVYARHRDYHDLIKGRLKQLAQWLIGKQGGEVKVFVDTAPVMEKPLAASAGLGWQGKHTNLVARSFGSWLFLGTIFTTLELEPDAPIGDHCGSCRACLDICPTQAFPAPYQLDARRCLSYLTIESKAMIGREFRTAMGNRIYGCDDCLAVCPWNKFAQQTREVKLIARDELRAPSLNRLLQLDEAGFRAFFAGGPIKRIGYARFLRNCLIAAGNSADMTLLPLVENSINSSHPQVRASAIWALFQLAPQRAIQLRSALARQENDPLVKEEWETFFDAP